MKKALAWMVIGMVLALILGPIFWVFWVAVVVTLVITWAINTITKGKDG